MTKAGEPIQPTVSKARAAVSNVSCNGSFGLLLHQEIKNEGGTCRNSRTK